MSGLVGVSFPAKILEDDASMQAHDPTTPPGVALVLEGGGFRGMFTAGVLDAFLRARLHFGRALGVSAGAAYGVSYVSRQEGRNLAVSNGYAWTRAYYGLGNFLRCGSFFDWEYIYGEVPQKLVPLDYAEIRRSSTRLECVITSCRTGRAEYVPANDLDPDALKDLLAATSSLPLIAKPIALHGEPFMDGGIADPIPIERALAKGSERVVAVLTRPAGYRKKRSALVALLGKTYRRYPELGRAFSRRADAYNAALDRLAELERDGRAFAVRPDAEIPVGRTENDAPKLEALFHAGEALAERILPGLEEWLGR
jgi:predicted patatin/cPLA2 family phospholipase